MKKLRLWHLKRKLNKIQYELAWLELQLTFKRMNFGCYEYLIGKYEKSFDKVMNKIKALED